MSSPFPGMDPYLEATDLWPLFHETVVNCLIEIVRPGGLHDRYQARIQERRYITQHEHREKYIEIVQKSDDHLVTLVDFVSPSNKTTAVGRQAYLSTRRASKEANANIVEIDLVLQGPPMLEYSREGLPDWDYAVTVTRSTQPERYEIYTATLNKRLPRFRLPLASDDRDTVADLQAVFARAYDQADFASRINYKEVPPFLHDKIAKAAYHLWKKEGCPHGRDKEHWDMAVEEFKRLMKMG